MKCFLYYHDLLYLIDPDLLLKLYDAESLVQYIAKNPFDQTLGESCGLGGCTSGSKPLECSECGLEYVLVSLGM